MGAYQGEAVEISVLLTFSEQYHFVRLEGHTWPSEPGRVDTDMLSSVKLGGMETITISLAHGAGGNANLSGNYIYGDHREPYREAGLWGLFRVHAAGQATAKLRSEAKR